MRLGWSVSPSSAAKLLRVGGLTLSAHSVTTWVAVRTRTCGMTPTMKPVPRTSLVPVRSLNPTIITKTPESSASSLGVSCASLQRGPLGLALLSSGGKYKIQLSSATIRRWMIVGPCEAYRGVVRGSIWENTPLGRHGLIPLGLQPLGGMGDDPPCDARRVPSKASGDGFRRVRWLLGRGWKRRARTDESLTEGRERQNSMLMIIDSWRAIAVPVVLRFSKYGFAERL